jgi:hypothetical protein
MGAELKLHKLTVLVPEGSIKGLRQVADGLCPAAAGGDGQAVAEA